MEPIGSRQPRRLELDGRARRHAAAVVNTLKMADEAAKEQDYDEALNWLSTLEAIGERIPDHYEARRQAWSAKLADQREGK